MTLCHALTSYFALTKLQFKIVELMFQFLIKIIFAKVNIRVPLPPAYICEVWNYSKANVENIKYAISNSNWGKAFENLSVDGKVKLLTKIILNIFRNYIPNKKIKCDYNQPPWINNNIKCSLKQRSKLTKIY